MSKLDASHLQIPICFTDGADYYTLGNHLWAGAKYRWEQASFETRRKVYRRVLKHFATSDEDLPSLEAINDFMWFECDDLFAEDYQTAEETEG